MRVLYENIADLSNTLTADTTSGTLVAANMLNDLKSEIWRSGSRTCQITVKWLVAMNMNMAALIFTNLTATATMRVRAYTGANDAIGSPVFDTGVVNACTYAPLGNLNWGSGPLGVNAFRFGGVSHGRVYFSTPQTAAKLIIDIVDVDNINAYVEVARLLVGTYWESDTNAEYGAEFLYKFYTQHEETQSGDLRTERRPRRRGLNFNLAWIMSINDQFALYEIMFAAGMDTPIFVSLFPLNLDPLLEQRCQMYAKLDGDHTMSHPSFGVFAMPIRLLEI